MSSCRKKKTKKEPLIIFVKIKCGGRHQSVPKARSEFLVWGMAIALLVGSPRIFDASVFEHGVFRSCFRVDRLLQLHVLFGRQEHDVVSVQALVCWNRESHRTLSPWTANSFCDILLQLEEHRRHDVSELWRVTDLCLRPAEAEELFGRGLK